MAMRLGIAAFLLLLCGTSAIAEEVFGVAVYPGAQFDEAASQALAKNPQVHGAAFRTDDDIGKVSTFYRKQGLVLMKVGSPSPERVRFKQMEKNVDVVVQQPWKEPYSKAVMKDTLILIMREKETGGR